VQLAVASSINNAGAKPLYFFNVSIELSIQHFII
jgi:hypothetical protein